MAKPTVACIDVPDLPLQMLLREHPAWRRGPAAVIAEDRPDAPLLALNAAARRARLSPGMRYGTARDLVPSLRAGVVPDGRVNETVEDLRAALQTFSPRVEADGSRPGVLYADPGGLERIYGSVRNWASSIHQYLSGRGFRSAVVAGFGRFPTFCIARTRTGITILRDPAEARARLWAVPLEAIGVSPELRDGLALLDVRTVGDLVGLPAASLHARFGPEASRLHALACDDPQLPMQPRAVVEPVRVELEVDPPDADHARLLFAIKGALHELLRQVAARSMTLSALRLELTLETRPSTTHAERIEPSRPTRDAMLLIDLVRLRLGEATLTAPVEAIALEAELAAPAGDQLALFRAATRRDRAAAERGLARVRAAYGAKSVTRARLRDGHLPEATFAFEPLESLPSARGETPPAPESPPLVRRVLSRPRPLPANDAAHPDSGPWLGDGDRALVRLFGPYRVSGGWWVRTVERDYYYGETGRGDLLWLYYDRPRRRWFLHGVVD